MNSFILFVLPLCAADSLRFHVIRQWKQLNFTWPDEEALRAATEKGLYDPRNVTCSGIRYHDSHFYLTLPRLKPGVPATLARIAAGEVRNPSPPLEPFPSWQMNALEDCQSLQNVQNVEVDAKGRMWIVDRGYGSCGPKLVIFDFDQNKTVLNFAFPEEVAPKNTSFLFDLVVDDTDGGFAYITDNSASDPGIIVYSLKQNRSWKIRHPSMAADPSNAHFTVNGISIRTPMNVAAIALGPKLRTSNDKIIVNDDREVYFSPLSSRHLYSVNSTTLRNDNSTMHNFTVRDLGVKSSQTGSMIMDNKGVLYYSLLGNNAVGCWNSTTSFEAGQKMIAKDAKFLEWPSSFSFDGRGNLTVLVNRLDRFLFGKFDLNEYNFWLISANVEGTSYVYDEKFSYDVSTEVSTTSTSSRSNATSPSDDVTIAKATAGSIRNLVSLVPLVVCFLVVLVRLI